MPRDQKPSNQMTRIYFYFKKFFFHGTTFLRVEFPPDGTNRIMAKKYIIYPLNTNKERKKEQNRRNDRRKHIILKLTYHLTTFLVLVE